MLGFCELGTSLNALIIKKALMYKFGTSCLNCKIVLSKSYLCFSRIAILSYKITGISRQHNIIYLSFSTFGQINHFADVSKMIRQISSRISS